MMLRIKHGSFILNCKREGFLSCQLNWGMIASGADTNVGSPNAFDSKITVPRSRSKTLLRQFDDASVGKPQSM